MIIIIKFFFLKQKKKNIVEQRVSRQKAFFKTHTADSTRNS